MNDNNKIQDPPRLLGRSHLRDYILFTIGIICIIVIYYLLTGFIGGSPPPGGGSPPTGPGRGPINVADMFNLWPLWGQLILPSLASILMAIGALAMVAILYVAVRRYDYKLPSLPILVIVGVFLIFLTNLIQGWHVGIEIPIGGMGEIYWDISSVVNPFSFLSDYNTLQETLSVHAQTQPPGTVLVIYLLNILFQSPAGVAIGLGFLSGVVSAFFVNGIYSKLFSNDSAKYGTFLYLLLPAIQIYYLANIYAIVATLAAGTLYFYMHSNQLLSTVGILVSLFLGLFISFLFLYIPLMLLIFELLTSWSSTRELGVSDKLKQTFTSLGKIFVACLGVLLLYTLLYVGLGFSYVESFLYASSLENPNGFLLFANPGEYLVTRAQNVLDIIIFFGPVLGVLTFRGLKSMKNALTQDIEVTRAYNLVVSSLIALLLLFLAGAPKKGETARICMFILPFLLIPVIFYLDRNNFSRKEKIMLLLLVFGQTVLMQLFGIYIW